jgi:hypothetical protein
MCGGIERRDRQYSTDSRPTLGAVIAVLIVPLLAGCGKTTDELPAEPVATGDQSVFSEIQVDATLSAYDAVDNAPDEAGNFPAVAPIRPGASLRVRINAGTSETRVPGLEIFARGKPLREIGSAGLPQQFDYQGQLDEPLAESAVDLTFRYQDSSFTVAVAPLSVTIVSPAQDSRITRETLPVLTWVGLEQAPTLEVFGVCGFKLEPYEVTNTSVSFRAIPQTPPVGRTDNCTFTLYSSWQLEEEMQPSPFASLKVRRSVKHLHRLTLE